MRARTDAAESSGNPSAMPARPLAGRRIVLTRPVAQAGDFEARVRSLGGEPVVAPAIAVAPPESWDLADAVLVHIDDYDWVAFTSANAARALVARADAIGVDRDLLRRRRLAVVGPATGAAVAGLLRVPDAAARVHAAAALAAQLPDAAGACVLFPRGDLAGAALPDGLRSRGAIVDDVVVYRTVPGPGVAEIVECLRSGSADALIFASASAVRAVTGALTRSTRNAREVAGVRRAAVFCIGPATAEAARAAGMEPVAGVDVVTQDELIDRVARWFASRTQES